MIRSARHTHIGALSGAPFLLPALFLALGLGSGLSGCAQVPGSKATTDQGAYPALLGDTALQEAMPGPTPKNPEAELAARAGALKRKLAQSATAG
ncbi:MAG: hypothetical protein WBA91_07525 [Paracoccaceae bacterium]